MAHLKSRYKKFALGGAVTPETEPPPDVRTVQSEIEAAEPSSQDEIIDGLDMPSAASAAIEWLKKHPEFVFDAEQNAKIGALHRQVVEEGHQEFSEDYFNRLEEHLGYRDHAQTVAEKYAPAVEDPEPVRRVHRTSPARVSAPPSRERTMVSAYLRGNNYDISRGTITLSPSQKEAARIAGVSEADYALGLMELNRRKAMGDYGGQP